MKKLEIKLIDAPLPLCEAVQNFIDKRKDMNPNLLIVKKYELFPFQDKSITYTIFSAYVGVSNWLEVFKYTVSSEEKYTDTVVRSCGMTVGDVLEFVKHSESLRGGVERQLSPSSVG